MRIFAFLALVAILASMTVCAIAQTAPTQPATEPSPADSPDLVAIRQTARDFETAFNSRDAAAIVQLWTPDGEFVDSTGQVFSGRKAIEDEHKKVFAGTGQHRIKVLIDSLRLLNDSAAIEDGRTILEPAPVGAPAIGFYTTVLIKVDGKWYLSTVRESRLETPSSYHRVADLEWLIGTWVAEEHGSKSTSVYSWVANKSFVQRNYSVSHPDQTTTSGIQLIGFNPQGNHLQSWNFSSDGGHAVGIWSPLDNGWSIEIQGTLADGQNTSATNLYTRLDENAYAWRSIARTVDGQSLPDTNEVVLKRQTK